MDLSTIVIAIIFVYVITRMMPAKGVRQITTSDLKQELSDKNKQFIDVRTVAEYRANNIKQFNNIPLHSLKGDVNKLDKEKDVIVICQSGMRSNKACKVLKKAGFKKVTNVKGGMSAWH